MEVRDYRRKYARFGRIPRPVVRFVVCLLALWLPVAGILTWRAPAEAQTSAPVNMLYGSAPDAPDSELQAIVEDAVKGRSGEWGIVVKKLDTGQYAVVNGDRRQVSASLYKLWVLAELYHQAGTGEISLDTVGTITGADAAEDAFYGDLRLGVGTAISYRSAARMMIVLSDNTAAHFLARNLNPDRVNAFMQANGLSNSYLDWYGNGDNFTTPLDVLRELEMMATSGMVDAASSQAMIETMLDQQINNRLPLGLPAEARIAHKTGDLGSLLHDVGIVYGPSGPFVIVAMASRLYSLQDGFQGMPELARRVYAYFNEQPSSPARYFPETRQTVGHDFLKVWHELGGLDTFGFPIGPERMEGELLVQDFERARMELHPELVGAGGPHPTVALGLVGQERAAQLGLQWPRSGNTGEGLYFEGTGQEITGDFLSFWQNNGGERVFGWPISPQVEMVSNADGNSYPVQWFQRARMGFHSELPAGSRVVLGALGSELAAPR
jgi:beta-lactamase class A